MPIETDTPAIQPDTTPTDLPDDGAPAATEGQGEGDAPSEKPDEPVDVAALAAEAFDKGVETAIAPAAPAKDAPKDAADVAAAAAVTAPVIAAENVAPPVDVDKEIHDLNIKGKAEARFREMAGTIKDFSPLREVLAKHSIADPKQAEEIFETAARGIEWENTVLASTASPDQFGAALNVIKAMNSGDPKVMGVAFDSLLSEVQALGQKIGREVPGLFDPLDAHPDLKAEVENADLARARALEIASQRAAAAANDSRNTAQHKQQEDQQAMTQAMADVSALNDELKVSDPDFLRKLPYLQPALDTIRETLHPSQWARAIRAAHAKLPALPTVVAPAVAKTPPVGHMPVRAAGSGAPMRQKPRTAEEAFEMGIQSVSGQ